MLTIEALNKSFGGLEVLRNFNLSLGEREFLAVIGPNGAGKTTLFNIVTGCETPSSGTIRLGEETLSELTVERIAALGVARTFQNIRLFRRSTVHENLRVALRARGFREQEDENAVIDQTLTSFGLTNPKVLASELSAVQQRRLEVARALVRNPKLLLLDEPFTGCGVSEAIELARQIQNMQSKSASIIVVDHRPAILSTFCTRFVVLHLGEKIFDGSWEDLKNDRRVLDAYLGTGQFAL
jgi:branched-chain amino acid transport system ATP-binding protein